MSDPQPDHYSDLRARIETLWESRDTISPLTGGDDRLAIETALGLLDSGDLRVAEPSHGSWLVNVWLKQAVLLSFRLHPSTLMSGAGGVHAYDKVRMKFEGWGSNRFSEAAFRVVPGAIVRRSAYIAPGVVLMPCFVNVGAYVGRGTMIDTWATVGSCAQIGANCHISGGTGIGGVLEPLQAGPVIIEDDCFIGARSEVAGALWWSAAA
jgi:2,3,4,5-tetrahydropyridine-2-carboxylate N-succinyltransferase